MPALIPPKGRMGVGRRGDVTPPDAPSTRELWVYDFRTNQHFTLKTQPLTREHLNDFVAQYRPDERHKRDINPSGEAI